jgi:hypothetical protein
MSPRQSTLDDALESLAEMDCLSEAECHDAAYDLLGPTEVGAIREHCGRCPTCQARLAQAEADAQQATRHMLAALNEPGTPVILPARLKEVIDGVAEEPTPGPGLWQTWLSQVQRWIRPVPRIADALLVAARGMAGHGHAGSGERAIQVECGDVILKVLATVARDEGTEISVQVLDTLGRPLSGRKVELLSEEATAPATERTSLRGHAVFQNRPSGRHVLHVDDAGAVGLEIGSHVL